MSAGLGRKPSVFPLAAWVVSGQGQDDDPMHRSSLYSLPYEWQAAFTTRECSQGELPDHLLLHRPREEPLDIPTHVSKHIKLMIKPLRVPP